jgi:hypothetical protein
MAKRLKYLAFLALSLSLFIPGFSNASVIVSDSVQVTDVTPVTFCVVWATSEPATGSLDLFLDADGTIPDTGAVVTLESADHPPAEDIGVIKVKVVGLKPATKYFFRTRTMSKYDNTVYLYPNSSPLLEVMTEQESIIVRNDVVALKVSIGENEPAPGTLVIASVDKAVHPVSGWVGHGVPTQWAAINTNNFYDKTTHENLELDGGEAIDLVVYGGLLGLVELQDTVPQKSGEVQALKLAATLPGSGSGPATPDPAPVSTSKGGSGGGGGSCFIATAAFGSPLDSHVEILKSFKESHLAQHAVGKKLIEYYYRYLPAGTEYIKEHKN